MSVTVTSPLTGMSLDFPSPFQKSAGGNMPLAIKFHPLPPKDYVDVARKEIDELSIKLGDLAHGIFRRKVDARGDSQVDRAVVAIGKRSKTPGSRILDSLPTPSWSTLMIGSNSCAIQYGWSIYPAETN